MLDSIVVWTLIGVLAGVGAGIVLIYGFYNTPEQRTKRAQKREEYRQQREALQQQERDREKRESERRARQLENFRKQRFVVFFRNPQGGHCPFEAALMEALLEKRANVLTFPETQLEEIASGKYDALPSDTFALVGTSWSVRETRYVHGEILSESYEANDIFCDFRLIQKTDDSAKIIMSRSIQHEGVNWLAQSMVEDIVSVIDRISANSPEVSFPA